MRATLRLTAGCGILAVVSALDNGFRTPPMGWSSWYGFTQNIDEVMLREMADGMVAHGLRDAGYDQIWIDDGWALPRDNVTHKPTVDPKIFPSGMRNLSDYIHDRSLKFGIYTSKGPLTCLGYQPTQPKRPGSCGYEQIDANTYAHDWQVDQVKDDGCGTCPQDKGTPFTAMRDALNRTGRPIFYAIHSDGSPWKATSDSNGSVANMWRTGGDLSSSSYDMWLNRLDLATNDLMRPFVGPGAIANPDFLEVGYSPRNPKGRTQTVLEQRSMFTFWAALPGPLILSADLRPGASCGGIDDAEIKAILTNKEVIAVNQDPLVQPMRPIRRISGTEVWHRPLVKGSALILFNRNSTGLSHRSSEAELTAGTPITLKPCGGEVSIKFNHNGKQLQAAANKSLCLGSVGQSPCANPPTTTRLGLTQCNDNDSTQQWTYDSTTNQFNNDAHHDLNAGPTCNPDVGQEILLYPAQGHTNEKWTMMQNQDGFFISTISGGQCLSVVNGPPPARLIGVQWSELGLPSGSSATVRDLWNSKDLGLFKGGFSASVQPHEARIFTIQPV